MSETEGSAAPAAGGPRQFSVEHRRLERARLTRLGRLPGPLLAWSDRGRAQVIAVTALQAALVIGLALVIARVATGTYFPRYVAILALVLSVAVTAVNRSVNTRAEQRRPSP